MSLDKSIKSGKEHRKPHRGSKSFDHSCRNHGSCPYCKNNRTISDKRNRSKTDNYIEDWVKGEN